MEYLDFSKLNEKKNTRIPDSVLQKLNLKVNDGIQYFYNSKEIIIKKLNLDGTK